MSDGPHKSLPMRKGWRKLAEYAANGMFEPSHAAEYIPDALGEDWRDEKCNEVIKQLRDALNDPRQGSLFDQTNEQRLEALKGVSGAGFPLARLVVECVTQEVEAGRETSDAISNGVERALAEKLGRGMLQVEEHYRLSTDEGANQVRTGLQNAAAHASIRDIANQLLKIDGSSTPSPPRKRDGPDDGVLLP